MKYSLEEIEGMRRSVRDMHYVYGGPRVGAEQIESELRTYVLAGVTPQELSRRAAEHMERQCSPENKKHHEELMARVYE